MKFLQGIMAANRRFDVDPQVGMFPPGRVQEERAWAEIVCPHPSPTQTPSISLVLLFLLFSVARRTRHMYALDRRGGVQSFMHSLGLLQCCSQFLPTIISEPLQNMSLCFIILQNRWRCAPHNREMRVLHVLRRKEKERKGESETEIESERDISSQYMKG